MGYKVINGVLYPVGDFGRVNNSAGKVNKNLDKPLTKSFQETLKDELVKKNSFTISNHAAERMKDVSFNNSDMNLINEAINKARDKGAKNCLIVYKDVAMITSVENRTIITAVEGSRAKENVFTNIDSVVLL